MKEYKISEEVLSLILKYLLGKPMAEVEPLVNAIRKELQKNQGT